MKGQRKYIEETQDLLFLLEQAIKNESEQVGARILIRAIEYGLEIKDRYETTI